MNKIVVFLRKKRSVFNLIFVLFCILALALDLFGAFFAVNFAPLIYDVAFFAGLVSILAFGLRFGINARIPESILPIHNNLLNNMKMGKTEKTELIVSVIMISGVVSAWLRHEVLHELVTHLTVLSTVVIVVMDRLSQHWGGLSKDLADKAQEHEELLTVKAAASFDIAYIASVDSPFPFGNLKKGVGNAAIDFINVFEEDGLRGVLKAYSVSEDNACFMHPDNGNKTTGKSLYQLLGQINFENKNTSIFEESLLYALLDYARVHKYISGLYLKIL